MPFKIVAHVKIDTDIVLLPLMTAGEIAPWVRALNAQVKNLSRSSSPM